MYWTMNKLLQQRQVPLIDTRCPSLLACAPHTDHDNASTLSIA